MAEKKFKGIDNKTLVDLEELKDTLTENPHFDKVYFTKTGVHYFHVHELMEKGKGTGKYYGGLKVVPTLHRVVGEKKEYKNKSVHTPATMIVQEMTADEVLDYEFVEQKKESTPALERKQIRKNKLAKQAEELENANSVIA